ncbi:MAG TPA: MFS transporter, partial [Ardenticatenaceae bacterium]
MTTSASTPISRGAASIWSRSTVSWMLYDLANTIYSLNIVSLYFSLWIVNDMGGNDQLYGAINSFSMFLMFLSAPVIGALSDLTARRIPLLAVSTILCVLFTFFLGRGGLTVSLIFFTLANYFYQAGLIFYDALLPAVSTDANRGRVSGIGVGIGYIGSFIGLGAGYYLLEIGASKIAIFQTTAILFLLFALPCFMFVRERARADARPMTLGALRQAFGNVRGAIARARSYPGLGRFLLGRYFYTDAANTAMAFTAIYATNELGFTEMQTTLSLGVGIATAIVGGFVWGSVVDRIGPKKTLQRVLGIWLVTFVAII